MKAALFPIVGLIMVGGCSGSEDAGQQPTPSVQVTTVPARQGSATLWLTAFGSATPSTTATQTLSIAQPGQVTRLAVTAGATVKAGQALLLFAVQPSALSGYEAAVTTLATARKQRDTTAQLLGQQLATRDQLAQADKGVADARAALEAMRREGAGDAVQTLRAPYDGIVTAIPVAQGDRTQPGAALLTVARQGAILVTVGVDPAARDQVHPGAAVRLTDLGGTAAPAAGHVLRIDGQLNPATHLVDVDVTVAKGALLVGAPFQADIATGASNGWLVPHAAVVTSGDSARVFQVVGGKAHAIDVHILQTSAAQDVVAGTLDPRAALIVDGAYQVEDGGAVRQAAR
ncbi:efflux RND transporter periplasmic adaptor subunit [uncultured Sphingomonas sp.]|uniref:efflux RND transporter periplasmic adaptor subunit n=1 Tax=uncultured Sphingomonas sp. TaxID=158754 RepID=UPI00261ECE1B|nr:efflux RND transporter periplasmic adaptor subunit [uncultured Sphingomonas sp.]